MKKHPYLCISVDYFILLFAQFDLLYAQCRLYARDRNSAPLEWLLWMSTYLCTALTAVWAYRLRSKLHIPEWLHYLLCALYWAAGNSVILYITGCTDLLPQRGNYMEGISNVIWCFINYLPAALLLLAAVTEVISRITGKDGD